MKHFLSICLLFTFFISWKETGAQPAASPPVTNYHAIGAPLPKLRAMGPDSLLVSEAAFSRKGNVFVMMFNPTCDHCEAMAKLFVERDSLFHFGSVVLVSAPMMMKYLPDFAKATNMAQSKHMLMGEDRAGLIEAIFEYKTLPQINVYDHDLRLIKVFTGMVKPEELEPYIDKYLHTLS